MNYARNLLSSYDNRFISPTSRLANQLIANGTDTGPVQHWMQGVNRVVQAGVGL